MPTFDLTLLIPLLSAQLICDFALQGGSKARREPGPRRLALHASATGLTAYLLLGDFSEWRIPLLIASIHGTFELLHWRLGFQRMSSFRAFAIEQLTKLATIFSIAAVDWSRIGIFEPWWITHNPASYLHALGVVGGLAATTLGAGQLIALALPRMLESEADKPAQEAGLQKAGRYIGYLERVLLFIFVLGGHLAAAGLLIAAKSVLRFSKSGDSRSDSEYILAGTLLSYTLGISIAYSFKLMLGL